MKKVLILTVLLLVFVLVGCNDKERNFDIPREEQFIVGLEANYQPFNWTEDFSSPFNHPINNFPGKYADGYDVQIARAVAASLGKVLVIEKLDWDALIPSLEAKKIDAIIAGMSPTEDRKQSVNFTEEYYKSKHVVLVLADGEYTNAKSLNDFAGATIVSQQGTIYDDLVPQLVGATHGTPLKSVPDILTGMLGGRIDGTILELPVALGITQAIRNSSMWNWIMVLKYPKPMLLFRLQFVWKKPDWLRPSIKSWKESEDVRLKLMEDAVGRAE